MRTWLMLLLALIVPALTLSFSAAPLRRDLGLLPAPFAWQEVLIVHLLAGTALGLGLITLLTRRYPRLAATSPYMVVAGAGLASLTIYAVGPALGVVLDGVHAGWFARSLARSAICFLLQAPWLVLSFGATSSPTRWFAGVPASVPILIGLTAPPAYACHAIDEVTKRAEESLGAPRLVDAHHLAWGLCDLGSATPIAGGMPREVRRQIGEEIEQLRAEASLPLPTTASLARRMARARNLALLGRLDEAERMIDASDLANPEAKLLLALILQTRRKYARSDVLYREVVDSSGLPPRHRAAILTRAYDGLAFNARAEERFSVAQAIYEEALHRLPDAQAHFHFQLGRHFQQAGRSAAAHFHLSQAAELDSRYTDRAAPLLEELRKHSPACVIRR